MTPCIAYAYFGTATGKSLLRKLTLDCSQMSESQA
jgi:hypothetical protein